MDLRGILALLLTVALAAPGLGQQQTTPPVPATAPPSPAGPLKIVVLEGEGATNNIASRTATQLVVEVRDDSGKPVPGAEVLFQLPAAGPGAVFHGWMRTQTARTNEQGQAGTTGMVPNDEVGRFNIKVTATEGSRTGSVIISQTNARRTGGGQAMPGSSWKWKVIGLVATAGVIGGVYAAKRNGTTTTATAAATPITVTAGSVTVGAPR